MEWLSATGPKDHQSESKNGDDEQPPSTTAAITRQSTDYQDVVQTVTTVASNEGGSATYHPHTDFYNDVRFMRLTTILVFLNILGVTGLVLVTFLGLSSPFDMFIPRKFSGLWLPIAFLFSIIVYILFAQMFEGWYTALGARTNRLGYILVRTAQTVLYMGFLGGFILLPAMDQTFLGGLASNVVVTAAYCVPIGLYLLCVILDVLHFGTRRNT
ncbi:hypothetical protein EJ04DRAFT_526902 [Polyplosphaeria fusca]|uniref:Uncharacterized protein n=1 Tax=Polyplosphaeria fusca TaxID=682080 RepID=A0A9P4UZ03_9PLEO|nr:hypothetical protein EJ04DRAFT_526902 [Polyplosphaeria fusca]